MRREQVLRPAIALGALVVAAAVLRVAAHVLPVGLALAAATVLVVFAPGLALARLLGADELLDAPMLLAAAVPLGCAVWAIGLMGGMVAGLPLVGGGAGVALFAALATARPVPPRPAGRGAVAWLAAGGAALAFAASRLETELHGDALFHAGRVRKLADLPRLSLDGLSSVWHGSPHAGYVVPVLHAIDAAAIRPSPTPISRPAARCSSRWRPTRLARWRDGRPRSQRRRWPPGTCSPAERWKRSSSRPSSRSSC